MDGPCMRFNEKYYNNYEDCSVWFPITSLEEAIREACYAQDFSERRVLMLYFHNDNDAFSKQLCSYLKHKDIVDFLNDYFYVLAWDITSECDHAMLKNEVRNRFNLEIMVELITKKKSAVFLITTVSSILYVFSFMHGSIIKENLMLALQQVQAAMKEEYKVEEELQILCQEEYKVEEELQILCQDNVESEYGIGSVRFQQLMYDQLGDRSYDSFEFNEHEHLKSKIGFALYGPPPNVGGYEEKGKETIDHVYDKIRLVNNEHSKWHDRVVISFIYNCAEPLSAEKLITAKKYSDYDPLTDLSPVPVFVLRKCKGSDKPCRVFIDHDARVYGSWKEYIEENKLSKCKMILLKDGRYQGDEDVLLEEHFSPACKISAAVLTGTDAASTVADLASGGVFLAAMIPAITIAPIALTVAGITGVGVGLYSIVRSSLNLHDRATHRESTSFLNSEARGSYINIVAGSLGFFGAGATDAVTTLSANGVNIGMGARVLVNTINGATIAAGGVGIANSAYEVLHQIFVDNQAPSALTIVQLSSSILFFGNSVYNFRTAGTIIEETQVQTLNDINDSLRSNRHRKTYNKLLKETMRQRGETQGKAEVIATLKNINQRDEVLAVLTRSNKDFNKAGIKFSARDGKIALNGILVAILSYGSMQKSSQVQFRLELPPVPENFTNGDQIQITSNIMDMFQVNDLREIMSFGTQLILNPARFQVLIYNLLSRFTRNIQERIIIIVKLLIKKLIATEVNIADAFTKLSYDTDAMYKIIRFVVVYLQKKVDEMEQEYQNELSEARKRPNFTEEDFNAAYKIKINPCTAKRFVDFCALALDAFFLDIELAIRKLMDDFLMWLSVQICEFTKAGITREERERQKQRMKTKKTCPTCQGYYYT